MRTTCTFFSRLWLRTDHNCVPWFEEKVCISPCSAESDNDVSIQDTATQISHELALIWSNRKLELTANSHYKRLPYCWSPSLFKATVNKIEKMRFSEGKKLHLIGWTGTKCSQFQLGWPTEMQTAYKVTDINRIPEQWEDVHYSIVDFSEQS